MNPAITIKDMLAADPSTDIRKIFTHNDIIFTIKNQDPVLRTIFTYDNTRLLISYINQQHELDPNNRDICYKMPQSALQIMCCQSHSLTEMIFQGRCNNDNSNHQVKQDSLSKQEQNKQNQCLLEFLLQFLNYKQHYYLAGIFSKSMGSITKRAFAPSHKYNKILCHKIFGIRQQSGQNFLQPGCLFLALNHIYSQSMNELILRWLTLKSKQSSYSKQKQLFIKKLTQLINIDQQQKSKCQIKNFNEDSLNSICSLIMLLLKSPLQPPPQRPQPMQHKNINLLINKNSQKQLYQLICRQEYLRQILKPVPNPSIQKLTLIRKIVQQYRVQNQQIAKLEQKYMDIHLSDVITQQMLVQCIGWINQALLNMAQQIQYQDQQYKNAELDINSSLGVSMKDMKVTQQSKSKINKKLLVAYLQLLHQFHLLTQQMRQPLTFYYQQKQQEHVNVVIKFLRLKNNIISNLLTKIIMIVLEKLNCTDFVTALMHYGIAHVIDEEGIREHVLGWAKVILKTKNQQAHIYENAEEQAKWDHMSEIVANAEDIVIGKYRFKPACLETFYSVQKAKQYYSSFLQEPIVIEYEQKIPFKKVQSQPSQNQIKIQQNELSQLALKKNLSSPPSIEVTQLSGKNIKQQNKVSKQIQINDEEVIDIFGIDSMRNGYLQYDVDKIIRQMQ